MAEVAHHDHVHQTDSSGGSMGFLFGVILLVLALFLFFYYGLPLMQGNTGGTNISIPDRMNINLNQGQ